MQRSFKTNRAKVCLNRRMATLDSGEFLGKVRHATRIADAILSLVCHAKPRELPLHQHNLSYFCFLVSGKYKETYGNTTIEYEPFSIALHPERYAHTDAIVQPQTTFFTIELGDRWSSGLGQPFDFSKWRLELQYGDAVWLAVRLLRAVLDETVDSLLVEACISEMLAIALRMLEHDRAVRPWLANVKTELQERFAEKITLDELARNAGLHIASLARGFRLAEGVTIGDYVQRLRVQHACRLLSQRTTTLAEIAQECNFSDQSHLTRIFKAITGTTPADLRTELK